MKKRHCGRAQYGGRNPLESVFEFREIKNKKVVAFGKRKMIECAEENPYRVPKTDIYIRLTFDILKSRISIRTIICGVQIFPRGGGSGI